MCDSQRNFQREFQKVCERIANLFLSHEEVVQLRIRTGTTEEIHKKKQC